MFGNFKNIVGRKKIANEDLFIKRIRSLVIGEGMLLKGNIPLMELAIKEMPSQGSVLEIGSYGGLSTNLIIYFLKKHHRNNLLFNCDAWIYEGYNDGIEEHPLFIDGRDDVSRADYSVYMKNAFINSIRLLSSKKLPHSFHMDSALFFNKWNSNQTNVDLFGVHTQLGGPISFAYIDGGHSFEVAWNDFKNVADHLVKCGFILLDDSADHMNYGSSKMMEAIKKDKRFKIVSKNPNYLLQKIG
jgi:hypothetical protein